MTDFWQTPFRMIQPNLRKIDAIGMDVKELVRTIREFGGNVILANAGGIVSWYRSELPYQRMNEYLREDFVDAIIREAHRWGMKVLLRVDVSKQYDELYAEHPDWFAHDSSGGLIRHWDMAATCFTGPYWQEFSFALLDELLKRYDPDGFMYNGYHYTHCLCERCRREFYQASNAELPRTLDWGSSTGIQYIRYRYEKLAAYTQRLREYVHARKPEAVFTIDFHLTYDTPAHFANAGWFVPKMAQAVDVLFPEAFNDLSRPWPKWIYWAGEQARLARSFDKPIIVALTYSEMIATRRVAQPPSQIVHDIMQIAAHGGNPSIALSGTFKQDDRKAMSSVKGTYDFLQRNEAAYTDLEPIASSALLYSQKNLDFGGKGSGKERALFHYRGFYEALVHNHFQFDVLFDGSLSKNRLQPYKTLILPNVACLDEAEAQAIDSFVADGGNLIATFETALYDLDGHYQGEYALRCMGFTIGASSPTTGSYLLLCNRELLKSFGDTDMLPLEGDFLSVRSNGEPSRVVEDLALVPSIHNNTPEFAYWTGSLPERGLLVASYGRGKVAYLPWGVDKLYHLYGIPEYARLIADLVDYLNGEREVVTNAPPQVEISLSRGGQGLLIHLLNATGHQCKPYTEPIPIYEVDLLVRTEGSRAISMVTGQDMGCKRAGDYLRIKVARLEGFEVLRIL
jgi:hypothetical protein